jgi:hypothetical protein
VFAAAIRRRIKRYKKWVRIGGDKVKKMTGNDFSNFSNSF